MATPNLARPILLGAITSEWVGIYVLDKEGNQVGVFDTDPFVHVHIINTFEDDTGIVIDLGAYPDTPFAKSGAMDIPMFKDKSSRDNNTLKADLRRIHLHLSGDLVGQATYENLVKTPDSHADFFRMNPNFYGRDYCVFYATEWWHDSVNYANMAVLKHNVCENTQTYWTKANFYPGEAFFVPKPGSTDEDEGALVFVAIDGERGASNFIALDAKTMTEIDGASVELPFHIPFTAHGEFVIAAQEAVVV